MYSAEKLAEILKTPNFRERVAMRLIPGMFIVDKFGENPTISPASDPEDIREGEGIYVYDAFNTAPIASIASTNGGDTQETSVQ